MFAGEALSTRGVMDDTQDDHDLIVARLHLIDPQTALEVVLRLDHMRMEMDLMRAKMLRWRRLTWWAEVVFRTALLALVGVAVVILFALVVAFAAVPPR
jgi:hypothetical protein